jgi:Fe-S-cluster containining protein
MTQRPQPVLTVLDPESCSGCGLCCERIGSPVVLYQSRPAWADHHPFRPAGMPLHLIEEIDAHFAGTFRGGEPEDVCFWYDPETRQCKHYEWRPKVCRDYELGGHECRNLRRPYLSQLE